MQNVSFMLPQYTSAREKIDAFLKKVLLDLPKNKTALEKMKKKEHCLYNNMLLLERYKDGIEMELFEPKRELFRLLQKQRTRSLSGITAITILLKPWPCQGECVFCPTEARMPKSYLSGEPGVMRAILNKWDAKKQVDTRLKALDMMGHDTSKNELIILGGTWENYPEKYREEYVLRMYEGLNGKKSDTIIEAQILNENVTHRCIGLSLETRPDCVTEESIIHMRYLGATKVELGVQTVYDDVSDLVKRGHGQDAVYHATHLLRDAGFKIHYHIMPNLPGSDPERDEEMFRILFEDPGLKPDMLKVYPCVVVNHSELKEWEEKGQFQTYDDEVLIELLIRSKQYIPQYCRVMRLGRDIPAYDITNGNTITNIREVVHKRMKERGMKCECIRCREVGFSESESFELELNIMEFEASGGREFFLQFRDPHTHTLFAFTRLRIPSQIYSGKKHFIAELEGAGIIRELHTYGSVVGIGGKDDEKTQHQGYGKKLLQAAENILREHGIKKIAVISGIGVRDYYRKIGYTLEGMYMTKSL